MKNYSEIGGLVERGVSLRKGVFPNCFISFFQKSMFSLGRCSGKFGHCAARASLKI